jgi:hypothetical protein
MRFDASRSTCAPPKPATVSAKDRNARAKRPSPVNIALTRCM